MKAPDLVVGLYVRPNGWRARDGAWSKLYEIEAFEGKDVVLRDVMVPTDECRGSHATLTITPLQVIRGYTVITPAPVDVDYLSEMLAA